MHRFGTFLLGIFVATTLAASSESSSHATEMVDDHSANESSHGLNDSHHDGGDHHGEHHGIHVASINFDYVRQPLVVTVFMLVVVLCKLGFHKVHWLSNYVPESCLLIILGTAVGGILHATKVDTSYFYYIHPETFFLSLLPPCILEASYELHDTVFFKNLGTILVYAVIGTLLNCFIIGPILYGLALAGAMGSLQISLVQCLVFSSLIVAVDPVAVLAIFQEIGVNNVLYFLVFGESLLNDAVTVVLYNTMKTLSTMEEIPASEIAMACAAFFTVSLGGLAIGLIFGLITSVVTRWTQHVRVVEPLEILAMAYGSYLMAELFHFSGIISMIGCGLMQVHYAFHNISDHSATTVKYFTKMLSTTCDSIIFMFLGIALIRDDHAWNTGFVLFTLVLCLGVRFLVTIVLTFIANYTYRERTVNAQEQFIMGYGGLRGAVCFCLVAMLDDKEIPQKYIFQTAVFAEILFTVFFQGITIKPLVYKLKILLNEDKVLSLYQEINDHVAVHTLAGIEDIIGRYGQNKFKEFLIRIDDGLKTALQRDPLTNDEVIMELYKEIAVQQYYEDTWGPGDDDNSSQCLLYRPLPRINDEGEEVFDDETGKKQLVHSTSIVMPFDPNILRRIENMGVYDTINSVYSRKSLPPIRTGPTSPEVIGDKHRMQRFLSDTGEADKTATNMRRRRINQMIRKSISGPDYEDKDLTAKHLHKLLAKTSAANVFLRKTDRNMKQSEGTDLLYHLHEKQRRRDRYIRSQSVYGATTPHDMSHVGSPLGSDEQINKHDKSMEDGDKSKDSKVSSTPALNVDDSGKKVEYGPRVRHRTEGYKAPVPVVVYTPRFKPQRPTRLNDQQRRYTFGETAGDAAAAAATAAAASRASKRRDRTSLPPVTIEVDESLIRESTDNLPASAGPASTGATFSAPMVEPVATGQSVGVSVGDDADVADDDECVVLMPGDGDSSPKPPAVSQKGRGQLHRQDDIKI